MSKLELIELIVIAVFAVSLAIYYFIKAIKNHWLKQLQETINKAICEAETKGEKDPSFKIIKKDYVVDQVKNKCIELGIPWDLLKKLINKLIDKIIANYNIIKKGN